MRAPLLLLLGTAGCLGIPDPETGTPPPQRLGMGELPIDALGTERLEDPQAAASVIDGELEVYVTGVFTGPQTTDIDVEITAYNSSGAVVDTTNAQAYSETHGIFIGPDDVAHMFSWMPLVNGMPASLSVRIVETEPQPTYGQETLVEDWELFGLGTDAAFLEATLCDDEYEPDDTVRLRCEFVDPTGAPLGVDCRATGGSPEGTTGPDGCAVVASPTVSLPDDAVPVIFPW